MSRAVPWMKFYPSDWRADPALRVCSIAARGLWIEMLSLMHESERYGHLLINGKQPTDRQFSALVAVPFDELAGLLCELEDAGVFSRDRNGAIYSRRMIRDEKKAEHARKIGRMGGNPTLSKQKANPPQDKGPDNQEDNRGVKAHMPEARIQKEKTETKKPIPDGWEPQPFGDGTQSRRIVDSWSAMERAVHVEEFRAHHRKNGEKFSDWQSAWSTWVLRSERFKPRSNGSASEPGSYFESLERRERSEAIKREREAAAGRTATG